jgi:hypothetical protein
VTGDNLSEFWGFRGGIADEYVIPAYDAATMRNWIPTFRRDVVPLFSSVSNYSTFPRNVGIRLPTDATSHPKRTESPGDATFCNSAEWRTRHVLLTDPGWNADEYVQECAVHTVQRSSVAGKVPTTTRYEQITHPSTVVRGTVTREQVLSGYTGTVSVSLQVLWLAGRYCPDLRSLLFPKSSAEPLNNNARKITHVSEKFRNYAVFVDTNLSS